MWTLTVFALTGAALVSAFSTISTFAVRKNESISHCSLLSERFLTRSSNSDMPTYKHTLAILTLPETSVDRIANEAILETAMKHTTSKLSIVLRCQDGKLPKINELRGYVGEMYSLAWDVVLGLDTDISNRDVDLLNVIIYPHNLPNAAPEQWIHHRKDLDCICSHDSIIGWVSESRSGSSGEKFTNVEGSGVGGLNAHVEAINVDRSGRGLENVGSLSVEDWPEVCQEIQNPKGGEVVFLEDDYGEIEQIAFDEVEKTGGLIGGGYRIPSSSLYNSVAVGGTFDGMHYGHRKLLTLAISSVVPNGGKLLIGITTDEMLKNKSFAELIPSLQERIKGVRDFVDTLAPGMKNCMKIVPITDAYGPPGSPTDSDVYDGIANDFDALILSHETLPTGRKLNKHRVETLDLKPLTLLCTRRTEAHGMSSTTLRRMKKESEALQ